MLKPNHAASTTVLWEDERHGPLPALLLGFTMVTGLVDAVSYLRLGHVFVANMTGNVVFLGFAVADVQEFSIPASLVAIAAFLGGALAGGRIASVTANHRGRLLAVATYIELALVSAALVAFNLMPSLAVEWARYALIVVLAMAMGLQNAMARRLGVPDLTTTVLTLTLTGLAADSNLVGGTSPNRGRRLLATATMFLGAAVGATLTLLVSVSAVLALAWAVLAVEAVATCRFSSSSAAWTAGA